MPDKIIDQFSDLPMSRQRKYQLRKASRGLCQICTKPVMTGLTLCPTHVAIQAMRGRERTRLRHEGPGAPPPSPELDLRDAADCV